MQVDLIKSRIEKLKGDINRRMSGNERKIEKPNEIVNSVENILDFNERDQEGQELKVLNPE